MSFSTVLSASLKGLLAEFIHVEADISNGLPMIHMVGYLSSEVKEASERVRTALKNSGIQMPAKKIVINLSPGTGKKKGTAFDLPIAVAILVSLGAIPEENLEDTLVIGELGLDGTLKNIAGVLPIVDMAKKAGCKTCILPIENASEGCLVEGIDIIGVANLTETCNHLNESKVIKPTKRELLSEVENIWPHHLPDYSEIQGQNFAKRAVEVAVSGGHNLLFIGPPGSGKSMIASRIPSILPSVTTEESMEITKIYSAAGLIDKKRPLITNRPFRNVHHTVTKTALIGGGMIPNPGEISLAHGGVLFLDELAEFSKPVLEVLRQPMEERSIRITRAHGNFLFPADTMIVAAMNPCPCGNYPDYNKCTCTPWQIKNYLGRISQPFLDRLDICIEVPRIEYKALVSKEKQEESKRMRERVIQARQIQQERYKGSLIQTNAALTVKEVIKYCQLGRKENKLMEQAFSGFDLTARTYHKILKTARTIADLDGEAHIKEQHIKEAIGYRTPDKKYWGGTN